MKKERFCLIPAWNFPDVISSPKRNSLAGTFPLITGSATGIQKLMALDSGLRRDDVLEVPG